MMNLEHPSITRCLATGYPYNLDVIDPENDEEEDYEDELYSDFPEDAAFEEARERKAGWLD